MAIMECTVEFEGYVINPSFVQGYGASPVTLTEYETQVEEALERNIKDAAAFLDEHIIGWAKRIKHPLQMGSCTGCVLGQVFMDEPRRRFRRSDPEFFDSGYVRGVNFLRERGFNDRPGVFSSDKGVPFWEAEIAKRG